ncbi:MAG TPA: hypothetical protein VE964_08660 [Myxococcales bacterium]|nr:hypothetical protein [Myxococcales bacterium]
MTVRGLRLAACGLLAAVACTPDFQSPSQVTDLRVLAIRQEVDGGFADAFVDLAAPSVQEAQVRALVVDPLLRGNLVAQGRICAPTDTGRCDGLQPFGPDQPLSQGAMVQEPVYTLQVPPAAIAQALQSDDLKGFGGVRVQFSLEASDGDPHSPAMASKILLYTTAPESMRNHNPEIVALKITRDGVDQGAVMPGGTFSVTAGIEYGLQPVLESGPGGIEEYDTVDLSGKLVHLREEPRYSFFATTGVDFDRDDADEPLPGQPPPTNGIARFTAGPACGSIWVVARDGRGGVGWIGVSCTTPP